MQVSMVSGGQWEMYADIQKNLAVSQLYLMTQLGPINEKYIPHKHNMHLQK